VDSVDLSNTYLEWGRVNFALNGLQAAYAEGEWALIRSDVIQFITQAARKNYRWDIIILDPPGFSNSKKMRGTLDLRRDRRELIDHCLSVLSPGGTLWFSSNAKGVSLADGDFPDCTVEDMKAALTDEDFKGKKIPASYTIRSL